LKRPAEETKTLLMPSEKGKDVRGKTNYF